MDLQAVERLATDLLVINNKFLTEKLLLRGGIV